MGAKTRTNGAKRRPGPRGRRAVAARAGTREDLLGAAAQLFAERGFDGATAEVISRRAGATKAMINYHFGSKQGLYEAILVSTFAGISRRLDAVRARGGAAPEQLRAFLAEFASAATERPSFPATMVREILSGGKHLPEPAFQRILGVVGVVRGIVEQGIAEGSFRPVDPLLTHLQIVGGLLFFFVTEPFRHKAAHQMLPGLTPPTTADFVAHVQEMMVRGLATSPPAPGRK